MLNLIKKNKKYLVFMVSIVLIGLIVGIIYYYIQSSNVKNNIINIISTYDSFKYNAIIKDLIIMSLLLISSFFIIGLPLSLFYIFYEGFSIGFLLSLFFASFKIKGVIYLLLFLLFNKIIIFILMFFFIQKIINIARYMIGYIIYKKEGLIKEKIIKNFISSLSYIIIVFFLNIFLYFLSSFLFKELAFLLH